MTLGQGLRKKTIVFTRQSRANSPKLHFTIKKNLRLLAYSILLSKLRIFINKLIE